MPLLTLIFLRLDTDPYIFKLNDIDFNDSLMTLGLAEPLRNELLSVYNENKAEIRKILSEMTVSLNQYHDLSWRLNVKVIMIYVPWDCSVRFLCVE